MDDLLLDFNTLKVCGGNHLSEYSTDNGFQGLLAAPSRTAAW